MIIDADDIKSISAIDIDTDDAGLDDVLTEIADSVTSDIIAYIGQPVESGAVVYQFFGNGTYTHTLPYSKCTAVSDTESRGTPAESWVDVTSTVVLARTEGPASVYCDGGWELGREYRITLTVGWSTIPADILNVAREMAVIRYQELGNGNAISGRVLGVTSKAQNAGSMTATTAFADLSSRWERALQKYRIVPV